MCYASVGAERTRDAALGQDVVLTHFPHATGLADPRDLKTAVCMRQPASLLIREVSGENAKDVPFFVPETKVIFVPGDFNEEFVAHDGTPLYRLDELGYPDLHIAFDIIELNVALPQQKLLSAPAHEAMSRNFQEELVGVGTRGALRQSPIARGNNPPPTQPQAQPRHIRLTRARRSVETVIGAVALTIATSTVVSLAMLL